MLEKSTEINHVKGLEVAVETLEIEELEQRLEMSCTRCCVDVEVSLQPE
jgi:hypothetical protein